MELELFNKTYTPTIMRLIKILADKLEQEIQDDTKSDNHYIVLKAKDKIEVLAQAKMLLSIYPACKFCLEPECSSGHK